MTTHNLKQNTIWEHNAITAQDKKMRMFRKHPHEKPKTVK